jgi:hypothetical protein
MKNQNLQFELLTQEELCAINGGGLVEDIGYAAHWIVDQACKAKNWIVEQWDNLVN